MAGHSLAKHGPVGWEEVDETLGEASLAEDLVDEIVGEDGGVTGLPQSNIALEYNYQSLSIVPTVPLP